MKDRRSSQRLVLRRRSVIALAVFAMMTIVAHVAQVAQAATPAPVRRIVAVGDLHGDFQAWRAIAKAAGLVDQDGRWTGGAAVLVQMGDAVDRGPDSLGIVNDLMRLQREATRRGGRVVALVGNHEVMNMTDDLRYLTDGDYAAFSTPQSAKLRETMYEQNKAVIETTYRRSDAHLDSHAIKQAWIAGTPLGKIEHQRAWHPEGRIGHWVVHNPAVTMIDGTLFVHGGINSAYARLSLIEINHRVSAALETRDADPIAIINDPSGPLWYRGWAEPSQPETAATLDQVLAAYGARRMVIAHTPILSGIATLYGGKLFRIDTGISAFYGGKLSYLEILDGVASPHEVERPV